MTAWKCSSLRARVLVTTTLVCLCVWGSWAVWQAQRMLRPAAGYWDEGLLSFTTYVMGSIPADMGLQQPTSSPSPQPARQAASDKSNVFHVWGRDGKLIFGSPGAPTQPLFPLGSGASERFATVHHGGQRWRAVIVTHPNRPFEVHTAKPELAMQAELSRAVWAALPTALGLLILLLFGLWFAVGWAVNGVDRVRRDIEQRGEHDLTRIPMELLPKEMRPIVAAFNELLERLSVALTNEKRFISDAAHELRTPLAALRAQAQVAQRMSTEPQLKESLNKLTVIIDRATRLANQLLTFARFEAAGTNTVVETIALESLTLDISHEFSELARQRNLHLKIQAAPTQIRGNTEQIGALLRNLIDNAVRYTPEGGTVAVDCRAHDTYVTLSVADSGPGIPDAEHALVFERFYRGQTAQASGSGLGLSIVREVVERHQGKLQLLGGLALDGSGLTVMVQLPKRLSAIPA
jgi:signal transduction histidine kinase